MLDRKLTILYGSQTGTAQDLAERLYRESKMFHFVGPVLAMDNFDVSQLINEQLVLFVCSTTGQGEEPDNMKMFWKFLLRKSLPADSLRSMRFAVLGLGDSGYAKFNFVAKRLNRRLLQLGGQQLIPAGLCDDQHDMGSSGVSMPWIADLWSALLEVSPIPVGKQPLSAVVRQEKWQVSVIDEDKENHAHLQPDKVDLYGGCVDAVFNKPFVATVVVRFLK